jgi:hypothetical protein
MYEGQLEVERRAHAATKAAAASRERDLEEQLGSSRWVHGTVLLHHRVMDYHDPFVLACPTQPHPTGTAGVGHGRWLTAFVSQLHDICQHWCRA